MGGGVAAGFLSAFSDAAKKKADDRAEDLRTQKNKVADMYWAAIHNAKDPAEIDEARKQLDKLYPKDPQIKQLLDKFHGMLQHTHPAYQQQPQTGANAPLEGGGIPPGMRSSVPPPPQPPGAPGASPAATNMAPGAQPGGALPMQSGAGSVPPPPQAPSMPPGAAPIPNASPNDRNIPPSPIPNADPNNPPKMQPLAAQGQTSQAPPMSTFARLAIAGRGPTPEQEDQRKLDLYKKEQDIVHQHKMEEQKAAAEAKAANPTGVARATSPTSLSRAKQLAKAGVTFKSADPAYADEDGNINVDELPDDMMLVPLQQNGKLVGYIPASQRQKIVRYNGQVHAIPEFDLTKDDASGGGGTTKGLANPGTVTATTDPATGQTTTTKRTPIIPGGGAGGAATSGAGKAATTPAGAAAGKSAPGAKATPAKPTPTPPTPQGLPPLEADADGNVRIPASMGPPQVVAGANDLLNGRGIKEMSGTSKTKGLSEELARKYGWEQGLFTPKEKMQIGESTHFIDEFDKSDSLSTLEEGSFHRARIAQILAGAKEQGPMGTMGTIFASNTDDPKVKEFVRQYNQTVQTISGLRQITSPGRATEAAIQRLLADLPNPKTTNSVADAHARLGLLRDEINYAVKFGKWKQPDSARSSVKPPPKASEASGPVKWTRDAQGNPIPAPASP